MKQFAYAFVVIEKNYSGTGCNVGINQHCGVMEAVNVDEATGKVHRLAEMRYKGKQVFVKIGHTYPQCVVKNVKDARFINEHGEVVK